MSLLVVPFMIDAAAGAWTNMPTAATLFNGSHRHVTRVDLTGFTEVRLVVNKQATAGAAASKLALRFSASFQASAGGYENIGAGGAEVACSPLNVQNTIVTSAWTPLIAGARTDVFLALVGSGGDGALDPAFGSVVAEFR